MRRYVGAIITLVVLVAVGLGLVFALGALSQPQPSLVAGNAGTTQDAQGNTLKQATIHLETYPFNPYEDSDFIKAHVTGQTLDGYPFPSQAGDHPDWVTYWPTTTLVVPAHALVTVTIDNYDSPTPLLNPYYGVPHGTLSGSITVDGEQETGVDPANVSHTFTIHGLPGANNQPWLFVSVPITGVDPNAPTDNAGMPNQPTTTTFTFETQGPGTYIWQCFDPCGSGFNGFGGPMSTKGYMSGTITVQ